MTPYELSIHKEYDKRITTLGRIKTRCLGADELSLTALEVLVYSQLEGGVKDLTGIVIKEINRRKMSLGQVNPKILNWRNSEVKDKLKRTVNLDTMTNANPFGQILTKQIKISPINRRYELNQMGWPSVKKVYGGFGLNLSGIASLESDVDAIVSSRNDAAHYGVMPSLARGLFETQVTKNVVVVSSVLTDYTMQLLDFFNLGLHRR